MLGPAELAALAGVAVAVGGLIGCVGVGGVILVPAMAYLFGVPVQAAIAAAMMGYLLTGAVGATIYARRKSIDWPMAIWLCAGAMPAALAGAWTSNHVPAIVLEFLIGLLTIGAGTHALLNRNGGEGKDRVLGRPALVAIGTVTGVLSAMTGTGGPLILVPTLLWLGVPVLTTIGLSQAVQFPIASLATVGNTLYGELDILLGGLLAVALAVGVGLGAHLAHRLPTDVLRRIVAAVLVLVGLAIVGKIVTG